MPEAPAAPSSTKADQPSSEVQEEDKAADRSYPLKDSGSTASATWPPGVLDKASFTYTRCYCEENVYLLLSRLADSNSSSDWAAARSWGSSSSRCFAVVISNADKCIPIWHQRASVDPAHQPVLWDYHVIALVLPPPVAGGPGLVLDLDTDLPFPCPAPTYCQRAFRPDMRIEPAFRQRFRVVPWACFRDHFSSDRSHMRTPDGQWSSPPPSYPPLRGAKAESSMTLPRLWSMEEQEDGCYGRVLTLQEFGRLCRGEDDAGLLPAAAASESGGGS